MLVIKILILIASGGLLAYEIYKLVDDIKSRKKKPPNFEYDGDNLNG